MVIITITTFFVHALTVDGIAFFVHTFYLSSFGFSLSHNSVKLVTDNPTWKLSTETERDAVIKKMRSRMKADRLSVKYVYR